MLGRWLGGLNILDGDEVAIGDEGRLVGDCMPVAFEINGPPKLPCPEPPIAIALFSKVLLPVVPNVVFVVAKVGDC